ncbi:MAG: urease accessory protein UreF [Hyphomicrobiaceae bacterium]|nr:urease accessory protein UreF [Hyphomicrobiaceae bacterium]MCC0023373.1 urease accessory protein UreF [Hyphomicrobiaceae bacterium]
MNMPTAMTILTSMDEDGLVKLSYWLSPSFPVGAFAYSHGLEQAIAEGLVVDRESLFDWLDFLVAHGGAFNDAVFVGAAIAGWNDGERLAKLTDLALALASSKERQVEQSEMGRAFAQAVELGGPLPNGIDPEHAAYPVVVGALAGRNDVPALPAIRLYVQAFCANLVAVAQRLVPLGQMDGVRVMSRLEPIIAANAKRAFQTDIGDIGGAALMSDIAAMKHETLKVRIFRT